MNRFNLTFSGEIVEGHDPELVRLRFANKFTIDDPAQLERFFNGETTTLQRNLERKDAAQLYHELQLIGVVATLVKSTSDDTTDKASKKSPARKTSRKRVNVVTRKTSRDTDLAAEVKARKLTAQKLSAEQAAQEKAAREAQQREADEARVREEALAAERRRLAEEERARQAAEQARQAEETAALKAAERAEAKRLEAEEVARKQALKAAAKRKAADEAAQRKARRLQKKVETARRQAEEATRRQAELDEKNRLAAEEDARRKTELEEKKRLAAEDEARRDAAVAEKDARSQAEQQDAQLESAERIPRSAPKRAKSRVKTTLDVPLRTKGETPQIGAPSQRKRQSGEPNLYQLRPFRNSAAVRARAADARQQMRRAYLLGVIALAILLISAGSYLRDNDQAMTTGAGAIAINANLEPLLLAGDTLLLHDRAGVSTTAIELDTLGVSMLAPPLVFDRQDALFALGRLAGHSADPASLDSLQLLRCEPDLSACAPYSPQLEDHHVDTFVINPLDGSLLLADSEAGQLLKVDSEGTIVARAAIALPQHPVLKLHGGLLLMNSAEGPAISVFRYEDDAFGQQLDEILVLPSTKLALDEARVGDFVWSGGAWWVNLRVPDAGAGELHRFDEAWNHLDSIALAPGSGPPQLVNWGSKTLINDPRQPAIKRYNAAGQVEAPFASTQLQEIVSAQEQRATLTSTVWHSALLLLALAALLGCGWGYWQGLRWLVYRPRREQGAEPLDDHIGALQWIEPIQNRQVTLRRTGFRYALGVIAALLLAIACNVSVWLLAALLLVLSGPAIALVLLSRQPVGHIGVLGDRLLLVDPSGLYHLGGGSRLQYRGPFLAIDDVVVFSGHRLLPAFCAAPLQRHVMPRTLVGVKVDHRTIAVKLLESRHPLALGAIAIAVAVAAAGLLASLPYIF